jgi:hypothetical protein
MTFGIDVLEDRTSPEWDRAQIHAGLPQQFQLPRTGRLVVDPDQAADPEPQARRRQRAISSCPTEAPASPIAVGHVAG